MENVITNKPKKRSTEKVNNKYNITKNKQNPTKKIKKCKVVSYIWHKNFIIVSFDGHNLRIDGITENPGDEVTIEYTGTVGEPGFSFEMK